MEKIKKDTKKQRQIGFYDDEIKSISYLAKSYKNDFSSTVRELVLRGMENISTAENLKDDLKFLVSKLERKNEELQNIIKENEKKTMKMMMNILKYGAKNNSLIKTFELERTKISKLELEEFKSFAERVEANAIKIMFSKIKKEGENEDELI